LKAILPVPFALYICWVTGCYSLGGNFAPLAAYAPLGRDAIPARVYKDPGDKSVPLLTKLDPFDHMVSWLYFCGFASHVLWFNDSDGVLCSSHRTIAI
jgi:hypothetical protein